MQHFFVSFYIDIMCFIRYTSYYIFIFSCTDDGDAVGGPVLGFSMLNYQVSESFPSVDICVQSSVPLLESATATVTTSDGTATGM